MDASSQNETGTKPGTHVERKSERELVVTRTVNGPVRLVFEAWTRPDLFQRWWTPASFGITVISFEADIRTGGTYRLVMSHSSAPEPMTFFGRYLEVTAHSRIVWTNEEAGDQGQVTTVTFEERNGATFLEVHDLYPSKAALDDAIESGSTGGWPEQFEQLDGLVATLDA